MAVFFWYLVKSDLSSVQVCSSVHWTSHFLQDARKTRPCLSGRVVQYRKKLRLLPRILRTTEGEAAVVRTIT